MTTLDLSVFKTIDYKPYDQTREPAVRINTESILFNVASLKALGQPQFIRLWLDEDGKRIAIQGAKKQGKDTINFSETRRSKDFDLHRTAIVKSIRRLMPNWNETAWYKAEGCYYPEENVMVYDLNTAAEYAGLKGKRV